MDSDFDGFDDWAVKTPVTTAGLVLDPARHSATPPAGPGCPDGDGDNVADQDDA